MIFRTDYIVGGSMAGRFFVWPKFPTGSGIFFVCGEIRLFCRRLKDAPRVGAFAGR